MEGEREIIELELKYCERCGGLWLRRKGHVEVFCGQCTGRVRRTPVAAKVGRPRLPVNRCIEMPLRKGAGGQV
ncbi:MAG TPA: hypothetical protein VLV49_17705 [Terriglobales bacterium]|nr:hypothetical protein [Terriglobales bacterium]